VKWNLERFLEALSPVVVDQRKGKLIFEKYQSLFDEAYFSGMRTKLGFKTEAENDASIIENLFSVMASTSSDFTLTFRILFEFASSDRADRDKDKFAQKLSEICATPEILSKMMARAQKIGRPTVSPERLLSLWSMVQQNPSEIAARFGTTPELLIEELKGEMEKLKASEMANERIQKLSSMSAENKAKEDKNEWLKWLEIYSERLGEERADLIGMERVNPAYILRNWKAQEVILAAEKGDFGPVNEELERLYEPFKNKITSHDVKAPDWAAELICTCSS